MTSTNPPGIEEGADGSSAFATGIAFEVHGILHGGKRACVLARLLDKVGDFRLTEAASLGGYPIEKWLDIPRVLDASGNQRYDIFAFCLRNAEDCAHFSKGQQIVLKT